MRYFFRHFLLLVFLSSIFLLAGCATMPSAKKIPIANTKHTIYFIYRGWHTSILLDAKILAAQNPQLASDLVGQTYARIGWGDGDYFTGKNKSTTTAAKALVASGYSAVQLLAYDYEPFEEIPVETIVPLALTDQGLQELVRFLGDSIAQDENGRPIRLPAFGDAMGSFFRSKDHYSLFSNCNTWSGRALRAAGLPVSTRLTAQGVFAQARFISHYQQEYGLFKKYL
jgi:uncharacterized protein (TIGR02117 family)